MIEPVIEFNGSKVSFLGTNYLARRVKNKTNNFESLIITYTDQFSKVVNYELKTQLDKFGKIINYEDPRWFVKDNSELYCSVVIVNFIEEVGHNTSMGYFNFKQEALFQNIIVPDFKLNSFPFSAENINSNRIFPLEKNWQFFFSEKKLYCFYVFYPEAILLNIATDTGRILKRNRFLYSRKLNYGFISGGIHPILIGNDFLSFFHTFTDTLNSNGVKKRVYHIGAALFENKFPFHIQKISEKPIYSAINSGPSEFGDYIIFPGSAELENGKWKLFCGKNDTELTSIEISSSNLEENFIQISKPVLLDKIRWDIYKLYSLTRRKLLSMYLRIK
jgi:predicted GH43/DUF377 family glycosyl hydrolase